MTKYLIILLLIFSQSVISQQIVNAVMVGNKGITENQREAKYLIIVKKYNDSAFERLEYNFAGPIKRRLTYKDPDLKILNGTYADYIWDYIKRRQLFR